MNSFVKIGISGFAGVMMAALTGTAFAEIGRSAGAVEDGDQGAVLQAQADAARARATNLARQGGWAYKTGAVDSATRDAARFQAQADAARGVTAGEPQVTAYVSPELAAAEARVQELRQAAGWAYKTGAVDRAEADVRALKGPQAVVAIGRNETARPAQNWGKPVEQNRRAYR